MKTDWKVVAQSPGYQSLKQSYQQTQKYSARFKDNSSELTRQTKQFHWIIYRAKHYAYHLNTSIEDVLNGWEANRTYNWRSYYSDHRFPKLGKTALTVKPMQMLNYFRKDPYYKNHPKSKKERVFKEILKQQRQDSKRVGDKARWTAERKKRAAQHRKYLADKAAKSSP